MGSPRAGSNPAGCEGSFGRSCCVFVQICGGSCPMTCCTGPLPTCGRQSREYPDPFIATTFPEQHNNRCCWTCESLELLSEVQQRSYLIGDLERQNPQDGDSLSSNRKESWRSWEKSQVYLTHYLGATLLKRATGISHRESRFASQWVVAKDPVSTFID